MTDSIERAFDAGKGAARTYRADARGADPARLWELLATPDHWPRWAPHISAVDDLGDAQLGRPSRSGHGDAPVREGQRLRIRGLGPVAVSARVTRVVDGHRWDFVVPLPLGVQVAATHEVHTDPRAVVVRMRVGGPLMAWVGGPGLLAYTLLAETALRRLVGLARRRGRS